jgi:hypothetical protein
MKKQVSIYVNPHVYKILRRDYGYVDVLIIRKRYHIYMHKDTVHPRKFLVPDPNLREIKIEGPDMNGRKAYAIIRNIEAQFREKINTYVLGQTAAGYPARTAVRDFLEKYDILDEEFKVDSAYKDWQRFEANDKKRNRIPLWI